MKKLLALLLSFLLLVQLPAPTAFASFDDQGAGARAPGMADAYTAVADDADAIGYNPAGLIQLEDGQITTQYGQLVKGLGDGSTLGTTYLGYAYPFVRGYRTLGFAYNNFKADNLFNERTITLSYGQRIDLERFGLNGIYSFGANAKQLHRQYEPDRFTENALNDAGVASNQRDQLFTTGNSKDTYAFDLGGLAQFGPKYQYTAGVSVINVNKPDVSLGGDGDKAPMSVKTGVAYRPRWGTLSLENRRTQRLVGQTDSDLALGIERNIPFASLGALIVRGGYASGSRGYKALTTGLSYMYARFRLDYAFNFPVNNLSGTSGTHRIGFAFKMGQSSPQLIKDYSNADLLAAFAYDSLTSHVLLTRISIGRNLPPDQRERLMLLLIRKYPLDDPGFKGVRADLREIINKHSTDLLDWPQLKFLLVRGVPDEEKAKALEVVEALVKNDPKGAMRRLVLLPPPVQKSDKIAPLFLMTLAELSAQSYRRQELDTCIDNVRRIVEIMPSDEVVLRAYRALLAQRAKITENFTSNEEEKLNVPDNVTETTPEAPQELVAPKLVEDESKRVITPQEQKAGESDALMKAFTASLGYYMLRKSAGASKDELISLLNQMKVAYEDNGIDMSLVNHELTELQKTQPTKPAVPIIKPTSKPVAPKPEKKKPVAKPVLAPEAKPATPAPKPTKPVEKPVNEELERAWTYYMDAVNRDISDHEKIELLQDMLSRFGEAGAGRVNKELERIRRRVE